MTYIEVQQLVLGLTKLDCNTLMWLNRKSNVALECVSTNDQMIHSNVVPPINLPLQPVFNLRSIFKIPIDQVNPDYDNVFELAMEAMEKLYEPMGGHDGGFTFNILEKREPTFSLGNFYGQAWPIKNTK